ncbi:hypothetical protein DSECCO2_356050 [anaerobic digester metagenome]
MMDQLTNNPFKTFFMGGFECADHLNRRGERINLLKETQHNFRVEQDYQLLSETGIHVVREGICWSEVEKTKEEYDFSNISSRISAAEKYGIQQIWDLIHFGYPDDLFPTHPMFCERFEKLCLAFARFYKAHAKQNLMVIPINEISFLSWFSGEDRGTTPYAANSGWDVKYHLCKAAIIGVKALKRTIPACRIIWAEPLIKIHGDGSATPGHLHEVNEYAYQAMDMISGKICPELGGDESFLDIVGLNYYWNCQWIIYSDTLPWPETENKRVPLHQLLQEVYDRYERPLFLAETGHFGVGRVPWMEEITSECLTALEKRVPIWGICIYPVLDRPDWDDLNRYSNCGLYDLDRNKNRIPEPGYLNAVIQQHRLFAERAGLTHAMTAQGYPLSG